MIQHLLAADPDLALSSDLLAKRGFGGGKGGSFTVTGPIIVIVIGVVIGVVYRVFSDPVRRQSIMTKLSNSTGTPRPQAGQYPPARPYPQAPAGVRPPSPGDVQAALDPSTPPMTLAHMIDHAPPLRPYVASNPATPPDLLARLHAFGEPEIGRRLAARGAPGGAAPNLRKAGPIPHPVPPRPPTASGPLQSGPPGRPPFPRQPR